MSSRYLSVLNDSQPSLVLDLLRAQWRTAKPTDAPALAATIAQWQRALWRFTTVGHIGKRNGPLAWQVPVLPLAASQEVRVKLPAPTSGNEVTLTGKVDSIYQKEEAERISWNAPGVWTVNNRIQVRGQGQGW